MISDGSNLCHTGALVIVNWNRAEDTARCLDAVLRGTCVPATMIIVDNGSEEAEYHRLVNLLNRVTDQVVIVRSEFNGGFALGANLGYRAAMNKECKTVWFLNNDAFPESSAYETLLRAAVALPPDWGALTSTIVTPAGNPWYIKGRIGRFSGVVWHGTRLKRKRFPTRPERVDFVSGCSLMVRAGVVEPPFSEQFFMYGEDVELSIRLAERQKLLFVVPTSFVVHQPSSSLGGSPDFFYYMARNRLLLTNSARRLHWWAALPYVFQRDVIPAFLHSRRHGLAALSGIRDYFEGTSGKRPSNDDQRGVER